jgi:HEPN domain-containing protein
MLPDEWFAKAREALTFAGAGFAASGIPGFASFLAHQAAELALKGYLATRRRDPPRLHDLVRLVDECQETEPSFSGAIEDALLLDPWYIPGRYPVQRTLAATAEDARDALAAAERILNAVGVANVLLPSRA